jgi:glycolate oxidase iron-sulfur subunit
MSTAAPSENLLKHLDYSVVQQCMHCGICLPTCPTYDITREERHSPRGRIALMRAIADDRIPLSKEFAEEMYYCLGCLACKTACPAGVDYPHLFEMARAEAERSGVLDSAPRQFIRWGLLKVLFGNYWMMHLFGRCLYLYRALGFQTLIRRSGIMKLMPQRLQKMERLTPTMERRFSNELIQYLEAPAQPRYTVGLLTGCVQDMMYATINRDTADVLLAAGCRVVTPRGQLCCGSLHAHNGDLELAKDFSRKLMDQFDLNEVDAIITNAGGCGSHLRHYDRLLADDPAYAERAKVWSAKLKDIHEWLIEIGFDKQLQALNLKTSPQRITYHESCHLAHGQGIVKQPRQLMKSIPGLELVELPESNWCCGSAGVYNLTQPDTAAELANRKMDNIVKTGCTTVATANPGCLLQLEKFSEIRNIKLTVTHPVSLIAEALRRGQ